MYMIAMQNIKSNAFKENRYHNTHKIPYPVVPRRSTHSMLSPIQGRPQVKEYPGFERYLKNTALGLHAETWKDTKSTTFVSGSTAATSRS